MATDATPAEEAGLEARLVEGCLRGEERAAEAVVREHSGPVWRMAMRLLGDEEEARDLAQEVFLRAFRRLGSFRGECSLRSWLLRITVNAARNRRRSWSRHRRARTVTLEEGRGGEPGRTPAATLADPAPGPDRRAEGSALRRRLAAALDGLPPGYREAVVLRDVEGLDYRSIARALGVRAGTVKSRIARGRELLRRALEDLAP